MLGTVFHCLPILLSPELAMTLACCRVYLLTTNSMHLSDVVIALLSGRKKELLSTILYTQCVSGTFG